MDAKDNKRVDDEIVIDGEDVERAQRLAEKRAGRKASVSGYENTIRISDDETLTSHPK